MHRLQLPILDPCHEDWDAMQAEGGKRFCDVCTKHVHDLSSMTERKARDTLTVERTKGRVCVRYRVAADGEIRFKLETTAAGGWRATLAAAGMAAMMLVGCTDSQPTEVTGDKCTYKTGPWTFTAERGEGNCPAPDPTEAVGIVTPLTDGDIEVMGEEKGIDEPEALLGKIGIEDPDPDFETIKGDVEDPMPVKGEVAGPTEIEEIEEMGDVAATLDPREEPCAGDGGTPPKGPRRL